MGKSARSKGSRGQSIAANMLRDRDWQVEVLTCGLMHEDLIATTPTAFPQPFALRALRYSVEVKNCKTITTTHRAQAMRQAKERSLPWMLMSHIEGTSSWLIQRQGESPVIWLQKETTQ
jgi:hypothetical protein